jgi:hypothetical protein
MHGNGCGVVQAHAEVRVCKLPRAACVVMTRTGFQLRRFREGPQQRVFLVDVAGGYGCSRRHHLAMFTCGHDASARANRIF